MKQFQLSVFYYGGFLSYAITTDDSVLFHFALKSAPDGALYAPAAFNVSHDNGNWKFDPEPDADFKLSVIHTLKKAKL